MCNRTENNVSSYQGQKHAKVKGKMFQRCSLVAGRRLCQLKTNNTHNNTVLFVSFKILLQIDSFVRNVKIVIDLWLRSHDSIYVDMDS